MVNAHDEATRDETTEMANDEELQAILEETTPVPGRFPEDEVTPIPETGLNLGTLKDRIAAGFLDLLVLGYLYWGCLLAYNFVVWRQLLRPFPVGTHALVFHALFGLTAFLYFFVSEGVFFTSLGKFFARLSVRSATGEAPSLLAVAIRNLLRPLDYLLLVLPTWVLLEKTARRQRLGDWLARTAVMRHYGRAPTRLVVGGQTASASLRMAAGVIDFLFAAAWIGGILLFVDYQRPVFSFLLFLLVPVFYLIWHVGWDALFQTTAGLWLFGLRLAQEDGSPIGFTQGMLRALFRLFDTNPIGWGILFLSKKNQRPSDLAAGTVAVHARRIWHPLIGIGVSLILVATVWFTGLVNPRNYLTPFFKLDFLSKVFTINIGGGPNIPASQGLFVKRFNYLLPDRKTMRPSAEFKAGETIYFSFDVTGFTVRNSEAWIQENLTVRYPDNNIGFKQENIVDFHQLLKDPEMPLEIVNTLALPANAAPGHYTLVMLLHDRFSDKQLTEQRTFLVVAE